MSQTTNGEDSKPHHRRTSSGVVHAWNTSAAGASNTRVMRISRSDGRVTTAEPWRVWWCWSFGVLLLELGEQVVEPVEPVVPVALEGADPIVDGLRPAPLTR